MSNRQRHALMILAVVLISLTLLAAPARGDDWWGLHIGSDGFGLAFGATGWSAWGASWGNPSWSIDYHVELSGYGEWVWVDGLGQCWQPWVTLNWRPFTHGRWVWTSFGWTWVAYEPWGYFPHHFGHWAMAPAGWVWVPGTSYHAANVVWVSNDAWIGWYPRPPLGWRHHHHHGHHDGWSEGWDDARYATFVGWQDLGSDDLSQRALGADAVRARTPAAVLREGGPAPTPQELSRRGVAVPEMSLERRTARVAGREVTLARPREAAATIERHAGRTVERALAPRAVDTVTRRATAGRSAAQTRSLPQAAATTAPHDGAAARDSRDGAPRGRRVETVRTAPAASAPAAASAPGREGTRTAGSQPGTSPDHPVAGARSASRGDSRGAPAPAPGTSVDATRARRATAASRSRVSGREAERQAAPSPAEKSHARSEERSRHSEAETAEVKTTARPSSRRGQ